MHILADITIKKLLEGNSNIQCRALKAKMINGDTVQISARNIDVDAIYGAYSHLEAEEDITVGLSRGDMEVILPLSLCNRSTVFGNNAVLNGLFICIKLACKCFFTAI